MKIEIVPSILVKDKDDAIDTIRAVEPFVNRAQVDIMDGLFVNNRTNDDLARIKTKLKLEFHLMVEDPIKYIKKYKNIAWMIILHFESFETEEELAKAIALVKKYKIKIGLAINPTTGVYRIQEMIKDLDLVLIMSVRPGFGGQNFIPTAMGRISTVRALNPKVDVEVDGGVRLALVPDLVRAGCNVIVAGKAVTHQHDVGAAVKRFKESAKKALEDW